MTYYRPVSPTERIWLVADRLCAPFCVQLILEGDGEPDPERWRRAVATAAEANPNARVRLKGVLGWTRWRDSGEPPPVQTVDAPDWDGESQVGAQFMATPMDLRRGASTDVWIVSGTRPRVVIRCHHATTDGRGALRFAADIGRALRGEPLEGSPSSVTDLVVARSVGKKAGFVPEDAVAATGTHAQSSSEVVWRRRLIPGHPRRFLARMAAAVITHTRHVAGGGAIRIDVPVDLRRHRADERASHNLTGIARIDAAGIESADDFDDALRAMVAAGGHADFVVGIDGVQWVPLWLAESIARKKTAACNQTSRYGSTATLSNLGLMDCEAMSGPEFRVTRAAMVPPAGHATPLFALCGGHAEGIDIAVSMPEPLANGGRLDAILDAMAAALRDDVPTKTG